VDLIAEAVAHADAAPQRVWDRLADGLRWRDWSPETDWMVVEGELAPGGIVTIKRKRGRQTAYHVEAAVAPERLALLLTFGPAARMRIAWTLEADGSGTRIRQTIETGGRLRRWLIDPQARRGAAKWAGDPARLAAILGTPVR
jgi:hypothetical protein